MKSLKIIITDVVNDILTTLKRGNNQHVYDDVPENIATAFLIKYPHAGSTTWQIRHDVYVASFVIKNNNYEAYYNADGRWLKTEMKIPLTRKLPRAINHSLKIGEFAAWYVKEIKKLEMRDQYLYVVHVDSGNLLDKKHNKFQTAALLYFDTDGRLLKIDEYKD